MNIRVKRYLTSMVDFTKFFWLLGEGVSLGTVQVVSDNSHEDFLDDIDSSLLFFW